MPLKNHKLGCACIQCEKLREESARKRERAASCPSDATACSACAESLKRMEDHMAKLVAKMVEVREEMIAEEVDFRLVPLTHQDSGVILAVCESIGVDLIPMTPWSGSLFLDAQQLSQLNDAMAEFRQPNVDVDLPDTAAQDSASKSNSPAVSG